VPDVESDPAIRPDGDVGDGGAIRAGVAQSGGVQAGALLYAVLFDLLYLLRPLAALVAVHATAFRDRAFGGVCSNRRPATTPNSLLRGIVSAHAEHAGSAGQYEHNSIASAMSSGSVESNSSRFPRHTAPGNAGVSRRTNSINPTVMRSLSIGVGWRW
jgi:hypothetical protein